MQACGLYVVKDQYFLDFPDPKWVDNKKETRPHYYALKDSDGVLWMIPMSSQVDNCRRKIARIEERRGKGNCIQFHIGKIAGKESVFKICDMFPVSEDYILRPYTIDEIPYVVKDRDLNKALYSKASRFIKLVSLEQIHCDHDIIGIKQVLLKKKEADASVV